MGGNAAPALSAYHSPDRRDSLSGGAAAARGAMSREELFLSQLAVIERVIGWVCARRGLRGADAEDFGSAVKTRLIENDYEVLGRFEGRSSLKTYLTAVVNRLYLDFQVRRFGKWRASAEARRLGPVALRLEQLLHRDGLTFEEACGVLESDPRVGVTRDALHAICQRLPSRPSRRPVAWDAEPEAREGGASNVERAERQALADRTFAVIRRTLGQLPSRERLFLRLHLESGFTVAEASRSLGLDQKALYRKKEDLLKRLRVQLEAEGIGAHDAHELLSVLDWDAALAAEAAGSISAGPEAAGSRPSQDVGRSDRRDGQP
jgi:RNA polymerase sigma factor (sigma-70 family)